MSIEGEKIRMEAKEKWGEIAEACVDSSEVEQYTGLIHKAFAHANSETQLETIGFRVGQVLVEKVSKDSPKLVTELEIVKFICKEFWSAVFGKQVDNLRTNHQGVYVVQDNKFTTLRCFPEGTQYVKSSGRFLALPCGILRGALDSLNIPAIVTATVESIPAVKFQLQIAAKA
ncbi:unnamed protein product [Caenorhabditis auriculariae]|uniref:Trafficking protein particle complex subunit 6B n=1 Tax=Caenorhabditis auriculariae TaxID=2777116 RepID=A0A8S1I029_9PELO|nr:unnamed protein product [Caenorhabditis auriculariae]